jgi:MYXO-CTERM domain-containing protein
MRRAVLLGGLLWILGPSGSAEAQFTDVSAAANVDIDDIKDGGASFGDLNHDGWLDLFVHANGESYLLISDGESPPTFTDRTAELAPRMTTIGQERAALIADLTNDGYNDLVRTDSDGFEIYVNSGPPNYTFGDPAYLDDEDTDALINGEGAAIVDYDRDGWLDIFMENTGPQIFENPRDGSAQVVLLDAVALGFPDGRALGTNGGYVSAVDFDGDGWVDLGYRNEDPWPALFANDGDGTFTALPSPTMTADRKGGIVFCDFDSDGLFDFLFTGGAGDGRNRIHLQNPARTFTETADPAPTGAIRDAACGDIDNDGDLDLYLAVDGTNPLYVNQLAETGSLAFVEMDLGVGAGNESECPTFADYDNDGDLDLHVNQTGDVYTDDTVTPPRTIRDPAPNVLFRNDTDDASYLMVEVLTSLPGTCPPVLRSDIGAVGSLSGRMRWESGARQINGGQGHGNQGSPRMHFGLGDDGPDRDYDLTIRFAAEAYPAVTLSVRPADLGPYQLLTVDATDVDGDGILTTTEVTQAGALPDLDGDGLPAWNDTDADGDGIPDAEEAGDTDLCTDPVDSDDSGVPDYLEGPFTPDAGIPDGSVDGAVGPDATADATSGEPMLQAHGTGCVQCRVGSDEGRRPTLAFFGLLVASLALRRRRR